MKSGVGQFWGRGFLLGKVKEKFCILLFFLFFFFISCCSFNLRTFLHFSEVTENSSQVKRKKHVFRKTLNSRRENGENW